MSYITLTKIKAALPESITAQLLDDHQVGAGDPSVWAEVVVAVEGEINGKLAQRFTLPLAEPVPALIAHCAFVLTAEALYQRRNYFDDANPWTKRAQGIRGTLGQQGGQAGLLDRIASGDEPLTPATAPAKPKAHLISEPSRTHSTLGNVLS